MYQASRYQPQTIAARTSAEVPRTMGVGTFWQETGFGEAGTGANADSKRPNVPFLASKSALRAGSERCRCCSGRLTLRLVTRTLIVGHAASGTTTV